MEYKLFSKVYSDFFEIIDNENETLVKQFLLSELSEYKENVSIYESYLEGVKNSENVLSSLERKIIYNMMEKSFNSQKNILMSNIHTLQ